MLRGCCAEYPWDVCRRCVDVVWTFRSQTTNFPSFLAQDRIQWVQMHSAHCKCASALRQQNPNSTLLRYVGLFWIKRIMLNEQNTLWSYNFDIYIALHGFQDAQKSIILLGASPATPHWVTFLGLQNSLRTAALSSCEQHSLRCAMLRLWCNDYCHKIWGRNFDYKILRHNCLNNQSQKPEYMSLPL